MKSKLFLGLVFLTAAFCAGAQVPEPKPISPEPAKTIVKSETEKNSPDTSDKINKSLNQDQPGYVRPDRKTRFNRYVKSMFGPTALAKTVFGAGYSTWQNSPEEWGGQWEGFGRRVASNLGKSAIKNTTGYALDEAFKLDSRFYRSKKKNFGSRVTNALISPFTARKPDGKRVFGFPRIVGTYTASIIAAETWYPSRYSYKNGLRSGTISLGTTALFNLVKEFFFKK
jgi:hypothetical protein